MKDTRCASCGRYTHTLSVLGTKLYCDDTCRRRHGLPGKNEVKRELRLGEVVTTFHVYSDGQRVKKPFYLVGKPYPTCPITRVYTFEKNNKQ